MANMVKKQPKRLNKGDKKKLVLTVVFAFIALFYLMPIFLVLINSFRQMPMSTPRPLPCRTKRALSALQTMPRA